MTNDSERNRFSARAARHASLGVNLGTAALRIALARAAGDGSSAATLAATLGSLKGPVMKIAQMMSTIPDLLPDDVMRALQGLQSDAPPMGAAFVSRRMRAELGPEWRTQFADFDLRPAAAASLGQVHRARGHDGRSLACKLQYPDMASTVEADLTQLDMLFGLHRRWGAPIDTREMAIEIRDRIREELDYQREARHIALYRNALDGEPLVRTPDVIPELSTRRLLTMTWLDGRKIQDFQEASATDRDRLGQAIYRAWWAPFFSVGAIHGDPHLGNYTVFGEAEGINMLDFGCVRIFPKRFVSGVIDLYRGLLQADDARIVHAYESWGFRGLRKDVIEILNIWARFIYGPLLDDRVRTIADGVAPADYGRKEVRSVHLALKEKGPLLIPREFVFLDRAAIGLGAAFLRLDARLNFHRLFEELIVLAEDRANFDRRRKAAFQRAGLEDVED